MDNLLILKAENTTLQDFQSKVQDELTSGEGKGKNVILDLLELIDVDLNSLLSFQSICDAHVESGCSFVIVNDSINFNDLPPSLHVTPTLEEAKDIIVMEDIERDLGF